MWSLAYIPVQSKLPIFEVKSVYFQWFSAGNVIFFGQAQKQLVALGKRE